MTHYGYITVSWKTALWGWLSDVQFNVQSLKLSTISQSNSHGTINSPQWALLVWTQWNVFFKTIWHKPVCRYKHVHTLMHSHADRHIPPIIASSLTVSKREIKQGDEGGIIIQHWSIQGGYLWQESSWHAPFLSLEARRKMEGLDHASCCPFLWIGLLTPRAAWLLGQDTPQSSPLTAKSQP